MGKVKAEKTEVLGHRMNIGQKMLANVKNLENMAGDDRVRKNTQTKSDQLRPNVFLLCYECE